AFTYPYDEKYLSVAFKEIEKIWMQNYNEITKINYVMLSEAPLWGERKNYIYNPIIKNTQFFYRSDLEFCLKETIKDKVEFINKLNAIGFIILDISPFPLNEKDTTINYRAISKHDYKSLLKDTLPFFLAEKFSLIQKKRSENLKIFFRYGRVKNTFNNLLGEIILNKRLTNSVNEIFDISQRGGGVDRNKLNSIINGTING
ncbi:MAG: hypothetical protein GY870_16975, partial [archaeon]|nr:hypothetical protein [archaeon]